MEFRIVFSSLLCLSFSWLTPSKGQAFILKSATPMTKDHLLQAVQSNPQVTELNLVPSILPEEFMMNFVLKHGVKRTGERGHLIEKKVSQSSDPLLPRVILFDERSGFTISYNGGGEGQTAPHRLDLLSFDEQLKTFTLEQIDFPIAAGRPQVTTSDCKQCHGPHQRPIFSMYPDWPSFYGSDNDELTGSSEVQKREWNDYRSFLKTTVPGHPRYAPLYDGDRVRKFLGVDLYPTFPYRQDVSTKAQDISRAFTFRPALRLGILYNRLTVQSVAKQMSLHPNYSSLKEYFLFNLMQCQWPDSMKASQEKWLKAVEKTLGQKAKALSGGQLDYRQNLALFGLRVNDVDIRYSYNHEGYENQDASKKVMEVGYIGRYFNSYFDGSATFDELLAAYLLTEIGTADPNFRKLFELHGLSSKYQHLTERFRLDRDFFEEMDQKGLWFPIPYPRVLFEVHHRETYKSEFTVQHGRVCQAIAQKIK